MRYAANNLPVLHCWRCGQVADVDWLDIQRFSNPAPMCIPGLVTCSTPGCVDENGTNATSPEPPSPREIQRKADAAVARFYAA